MVLISSEWFQYGSHSPKQALSLPSLSFIYFTFLFLPHTSPSSCFSPQITLHSLFAVVHSSSTEHLNDATVWSWVDLRSHTWECTAVNGAGWLLISQDLFQSFGGGGSCGGVQGWRGMKKPSSPKSWQKDQALHAKVIPALCTQALAVSKAQTYSTCIRWNRFLRLRMG